jgi:hypothetical protein
MLTETLEILQRSTRRIPGTRIYKLNRNSILGIIALQILKFVVRYLVKHNRSLKVAVQGPGFWPTPYTYIGILFISLLLILYNSYK